MADGYFLPRVDLHSHAGRCFLAGLPAGHPVAAALGAASVTGALRAAQAAGVTVLETSSPDARITRHCFHGAGYRGSQWPL